MNKQQIGKCGELLVQYRLLRCGIDSAPLTTDAGIDLVALAPASRTSFQIQVKTNAAPKPGGGRGRLCLDWWLEEESPADFVALVDLSTERIWMLTIEQMAALAQQRSGGKLHLYMHLEPEAAPRRKDTPMRDVDFDGYRLEVRIEHLLRWSPLDRGLAAG